MEAWISYLDFEQRLEQLTDMEAVKEAYLAFASSLLQDCRVLKTPRAMNATGFQRKEISHQLLSSNLMSISEECLYDELICVIGPRGSLGEEAQGMLERPRKAVHARLESLLMRPLTPVDLEQADFHRMLRTLSQGKEPPFVGILSRQTTSRA